MNTNPRPVFLHDMCEENLCFQYADVAIRVAGDAAWLEVVSGAIEEDTDGRAKRLVRHADIVYHRRAIDERTFSSVG